MKSITALKTLALLPLLGGSLSVANAASPLLDLGENAYAYFICEAGVTYNDNIFSARNKTDDVTFNITPGIELNIGSESNNRLTITAKENLIAYVDHDDLNKQLADVRATYVYDTESALKANVTGGFWQTAQNDNTVFVNGDLVERNHYSGAVELSYRLTEKSTFEVGFSYYNEHFSTYRDRYNDKQVYSVPVSWLYGVTDKLFAGLTYTYTYTDLDVTTNQLTLGQNPGNQQVHFVGLTTRGELSSKITVSARAGVGHQEFDDRVGLGGNDSGTTFNFSLSADYQATDKLRSRLTAGRKFDVGGQAQGITNTFVDLSGVYDLNEHWQTNANIGYSYQEFEVPNTGTDEIFHAGTGISFLPNKYWTISLGYRFLNNHSDRIAGYSINRVSLTASLKY